MISKDLIISKPDTIQNYDNYLKDYINLSGFNWNTDCLTITYTKLGNKFSDYVTKVGDYNTITATNPQLIPEQTWQEKDYSQPCPEGWTQNGGGCVNPLYNGKCNSGRTFSKPKNASCPEKKQAQFTNNGYWTKVWKWWGFFYPYQVSEYRSSQTPNQNFYSGWNGPTDASKANFERTNIGKKNQGEGTFCTAGWAAGNSLGGAQLDCAAGGGQWVNYWDDPGFWRNAYTCYKPTEFVNVTQPSSSFIGYDDNAKRNWENECEAAWPMKTITIPARYKCEYGVSIEEDIAKGNIFKIGNANSQLEAAKMVLNSLRLVDNYFFMIDSGVYIIGQNSNVGVITSKGVYEPNCTEKNNKKGTLYYINQKFFDELNKCKIVNQTLNNTNQSRDILQNAINSVREGFTSLDNIKAIAKNQNEISDNLRSDYNKKAELYNYQVDLISQNEKIVEVHNKKLNQQLNDLTSIQDQIALKDRVIELNDELTKKQIRNKKILIGFFVLIPLLGIPLLLVVTRAFSPFVGLGIAGLFIVGYIIFMLVVANQNDVKNFGKVDKRIISKYENAITKYWNKQKEALSKSLSKFVNGECADNGGSIGDNLQEEESGANPFVKNKYIMKENSPFYYYDGTAPPQQIYPGAIGSIDFSIDGIVDKNLKFPNEISENINKIKNPITKFFFEVWIQLLGKSGINLNDPRFKEDLDVIDYPDSDQTPPPYWDTIKLPIATSIRQQFSHLFKSLSADKINLSIKVSSNLVDLWNFVRGNKIPGDVYNKWVNKLATVLKEESPNIENFYQEFLDEIMSEMDSGNFVDSKIKEFIKTINTDIHVSQPFVKKYI
jgi:hypothetical protein